MSVTIRITDMPVEKEYCNTFVLRVHSTSGRHYTDSSEHAFTEANDSLVLETLQVLSVVEQEFDGELEEEHWDELTEDYSKPAVQLAFDLIGGDITNDGGTMAVLDGYEVTWFDSDGAEFVVEVEFF